MATTSQIKVLTPAEESTMYDKCPDFLSQKGIVVHHPEALKILDKAGAQVDFDNKQIRFPKDIIEEALRTVPRSFMLARSDGRHDCILPHPNGLFYTRNGTGARLYVASESGVSYVQD